MANIEYTPKEPNSREMVDWLLTQPEYPNKTEEDLESDMLIRVIASACKKPIQDVVAEFQKSLRRKFPGNRSSTQNQ